MTDPLAGGVLANRYRLEEKVGEGGMAVVYRGRDTLLGRSVAVKVLRDQYASDREFVERFRLEAQSAASLAHPNVVNIYDVGEDQNTHYIVMEFVDGHNLKELIKRRGRLGQMETVAIAIQIARALAAAHKSGLIHRDIKPHNILLTADDVVKVTDFGIARAQSAASLTQTGTVIGSVHYFSPQQARGEGLDLASDLYSLGVVMYEMLSGKLPFSGESPVAVALKHLNEQPRPLSSLVPGVDGELERVVHRLLAKDPKDRPKDAGTLVRELQAIGDRLASSPPAPQVPQDDDRTQVLPKMDDHDATRVHRLGEEEESMSPPHKRKSRGRRLAIWMVVLLSFIGGMAWAAQKLPELIFPEIVAVPDITGLDLESARRRLEEVGLRLHPDIQDTYSRQVPAGLIVRQDPQAEHRVRMGREIRVTLSRGPQYVVVPDVVGITKFEAELQITQQNLSLGSINEEFNPNVPPNTVIGQDPPGGTRLEEGARVDITVARGSQPQSTVRVPDVRGLPLGEAQRRLEALGLVVGQLHGEPHPSAAENEVIDQNPPPNDEVEVGHPYGLIYAVPLPPSQTGSSAPPTSVQNPYWETQVNIAVPEGPPQEVVIYVTDDWGPRQILRQVHQGGSRFSVPVTVRGAEATIQVWIDGIPQINERVRRRDGG